MRVLVIGHTYMEWHGRRKYEVLVETVPESDVTIVTPTVWPDAFRVLNGVPLQGTRLHILPLPAMLAGYGSRYTFAPVQLMEVFRTSRPDILFVEQEPWAMVYLQALVWARMLAPRALVGFFTWANVARGLPLPLALIEQVALRSTNFAVAGNHESIQLLRKRSYRGPIELIPQLGVDVDHFGRGDRERTYKRLELNDEPVIAFIGRLVPEKGLLTLLRGLASLRDLPWRLLMVGSGPLEASIVETAQRLGIRSRLILAGAVRQDEIADYLAACTVLVLPSERTPRWQEQFGHVLVEAMAARVAIVGSDSGEIPHVIGDAGMVFPEGDDQILAQQLRTLLCNPELRLELIRRGLQRVRTKYSEQVVASQLYDFFVSVLDARY